jgi:hypothetical protein
MHIWILNIFFKKLALISFNKEQDKEDEIEEKENGRWDHVHLPNSLRPHCK